MLSNKFITHLKKIKLLKNDFKGKKNKWHTLIASVRTNQKENTLYYISKVLEMLQPIIKTKHARQQTL